MKKRNRRWLLLLLGCMALGLWLTEATWAWPTVSVTDSGRIAMGTVAYSLQVRQEDSVVDDHSQLEPGSYTVAITATGDADGWFLLRLSSSEDGSEAVYYRTERMEPAQTMSFLLELAETAELTVDPRWDKPAEALTVLIEGDAIRWGENQPGQNTEETADATETGTETTEMESDPTETETESMEVTETEPEATEEPTETTEAAQQETPTDADAA